METFQKEHHYQQLFSGWNTKVPRLDGSCSRYINLDTAASTPSFRSVEKAVTNFLKYYSSVHRGMGFKSQVSTMAYEEARQIVLRFFKADPADHTCIFIKNTTEAINKLARRFPFTPERDVVFVSMMEHHSNDLPWRQAAKVLHIGVLPDGMLDLDDFERKLHQYQHRLALLSISGGSNVTGFINPIHDLAEKVHGVGALIAVDCAQLSPHRAIDMRPVSDPGHIDFITISGHKLYAPFGSGALVGLSRVFQIGEPETRGGGQVEIVTLDEVYWSGTPERDEAGSPNVVGAVALACALLTLSQIGMDVVAHHEAELTGYALEQLSKIKGLKIFGDTQSINAPSRLGVIPFQIDDISHFFLAAVLSYEFGIGVRNGCFCAHPYLMHLLDVHDEQAEVVRRAILAGDRTEVPGLVRISFGLYNNRKDINALVRALRTIVNRQYKGKYHQDPATGEFIPDKWPRDLRRYMPFNQALLEQA